MIMHMMDSESNIALFESAPSSGWKWCAMDLKATDATWKQSLTSNP